MNYKTEARMRTDGALRISSLMLVKSVNAIAAAAVEGKSVDEGKAALLSPVKFEINVSEMVGLVCVMTALAQLMRGKPIKEEHEEAVRDMLSYHMELLGGSLIIQFPEIVKPVLEKMSEE